MVMRIVKTLINSNCGSGVRGFVPEQVRTKKERESLISTGYALFLARLRLLFPLLLLFVFIQ